MVHPIHIAMKRIPTTTNRTGRTKAQRTGGFTHGHMKSHSGFAGAKSQYTYNIDPMSPKAKIAEPKLLSFILETRIMTMNTNKFR